MSQSTLELKKREVYRELEVYIDLVEEKYKKVFTDYQELADKINLNFGTTFDKEDVEHYYDKYYLQETEDMKLQVKNLGLIY